MPTYPTVAPTSFELTPVIVTFNSINLGGTLGNVVINSKYDKAELKTDQFGTTVMDRRVSGVVATVTTELVEVLNKDIAKVVFPHATLLSAGTAAIEFDTNVGDSDLSHAFELNLHPQSQGSGSVAYDWYFFKAVASAESTVTYGPTEQARWKIVWNILPDTSVSPARFWRYGDKTIV